MRYILSVDYVPSEIRNGRGKQFDPVIAELINEGCELIFTTSYGYQDTVRELAAQNPRIQFCQATGDNANTEPVLPNYHNFMVRVYEGRYAAGVVAGMKLREMIDEKVIGPDEAVVGYVAAFPYAEVISGYAAFFLGVRSVAPEALMTVRYTDTWSSYSQEYECAKEMTGEVCCCCRRFLPLKERFAAVAGKVLCR